MRSLPVAASKQRGATRKVKLAASVSERLLGRPSQVRSLTVAASKRRGRLTGKVKLAASVSDRLFWMALSGALPYGRD